MNSWKAISEKVRTSELGLATIVCDVCKTYVATAKKGAPRQMVVRAFNLAINTHLLMFHKSDPESVTFSYGLKSPS